MVPASCDEFLLLGLFLSTEDAYPDSDPRAVLIVESVGSHQALKEILEPDGRRVTDENLRPYARRPGAIGDVAEVAADEPVGGLQKAGDFFVCRHPVPRVDRPKDDGVTAGAAIRIDIQVGQIGTDFVIPLAKDPLPLPVQIRRFSDIVRVHVRKRKARFLLVFLQSGCRERGRDEPNHEYASEAIRPNSHYNLLQKHGFGSLGEMRLIR